MNPNLNLNDLSTKSTPYENFINENMMKSSQKLLADSDCNYRMFKQNFDDDKFKSDFKNIEKMSDESEEGSEIDLTTTGSPNNFVLVNGCIDFSNNNNNNNHSDK